MLLINHGDAPFRIEDGDRIAQLVIAAVQPAHFEAVDTLPEPTEGQSGGVRGDRGFGSTGAR